VDKNKGFLLIGLLIQRVRMLRIGWLRFNSWWNLPFVQFCSTQSKITSWGPDKIGSFYILVSAY